MANQLVETLWLIGLSSKLSVGRNYILHGSKRLQQASATLDHLITLIFDILPQPRKITFLDTVALQVFWDNHEIPLGLLLRHFWNENPLICN